MRTKSPLAFAMSATLFVMSYWAASSASVEPTGLALWYGFVAGTTLILTVMGMILAGVLFAEGL